METFDPMLRLWCALESRWRSERGQGTVEYVGLVVAVALLLVAVSETLQNGGGGIDDKVAAAIGRAVDKFTKS